MKRNIILLCLLIVIALTGCGDKSSASIDDLEYQVDNLSDEEIDTIVESTLNLLSLSSQYHSGSKFGRAELLTKTLNKLEQDGLVSDISQENDTIYYVSRNGNKQSVDTSKLEIAIRYLQNDETESEDVQYEYEDGRDEHGVLTDEAISDIAQEMKDTINSRPNLSGE